MASLNQLKNLLVDWFNGHAQINSVVYEDSFAFNSEAKLVYPVANIQYKGATLNGKTINYNFRVLIADLTDLEDLTAQDEAISDTLQVATDFFAWLDENFEFNRASKVTPFVNTNGDNVAGNMLDISIPQINSYNTCQTPMKN